MDDHHFSYITKLGKKNPSNVSSTFPSCLNDHMCKNNLTNVELFFIGLFVWIDFLHGLKLLTIVDLSSHVMSKGDHLFVESNNWLFEKIMKNFWHGHTKVIKHTHTHIKAKKI